MGTRSRESKRQLVLSFLAVLLSVTVAFSPTSVRGFPSCIHHHGSTSSNTALKSTPFSVGGPSSELLTRFSDQVTQELSASQFYLSASIWFDGRDWEGQAKYMLAESTEERGHALQLIDFANKRNIPIKLQKLDAPNSDWDSPEDVWKDVLKLEQSNTESLLRLAEAANECQDYAVLACLNPFHMEQVNAEDKISSIIAKVTDENKTPGLLRQLDHELGLETGQV